MDEDPEKSQTSEALKHAAILSLLPAFLSVAVAQTPDQHLRSLVVTEKAFASATAHLGVRNGFLTFFADDAVGFGDAPGRYKDLLEKRPFTAYPLPAILEWTPAEGDVARSGDLGYLTGPSKVRGRADGSPATYAGWYFSVWKRQQDGTWKVFIDLGTETPLTDIDIGSVDFSPAASFEEHPDTSSSGDSTSLRTADHGLNDALRLSPVVAGAALSPSVRFHRNGSFPLIGKDSALAQIRREIGGRTSHLRGEVSAAGDIGYTYGTFKKGEKGGHYVRVWKWTREKTWALLIDVRTEAK